jgi:hypothetical protein
MKTILEAAILALPILAVYLYLKKTKRWNEKTQKMLAIDGLIFVLVLVLGSSYFGVKRIGAPFERREYRTRYYVLMYPNIDRSKNYKVPAEVHVYTEGDEETEYRRVDLLRVFFPNGNVVGLNMDESLEFDKKLRGVDGYGQEWGIELTRQKAE